MRFFTTCLIASLLCPALPVSGYINPEAQKYNNQQNPIGYRNDCAQSTRQIEMDINNVRATLLNGGDVWWDLTNAGYIVPNVDPASGITPVSSIFAGAVWIGGYDDFKNLKLAAQTYRSPQRTDFWPGPLTSVGTTSRDTCRQWDRFFRVNGDNIRAHIRAYEEAQAEGRSMDCDAIPADIRGWPGKGNPYFFAINGWSLPFDTQGLGAFHDEDGDELYDPCQGDYPVIEIRGCDAPNFPDDMIFWIYNDAGNIHTNSQGDPIRMEVQVQAFAYATNDEINDMTFQRYKLINRATSIIDSCFFAMWIDPDLGCHTDDYIGCDIERSLMIVYNEDALDGTVGCVCEQNVPTYCDEIPILGVDYFRGPRGPVPFCDTVALSWVPGEDIIYIDSTAQLNDSMQVVCGERREELGMSSFTYYNNPGIGSHPAATTDPQPGAPMEFYRYISGRWRDGTPVTFGGSGYNPGNTNVIRYAFPDAPNDASGWSMCTSNLGFGDRRTLQATGPLRLDPGEVNELIIGVVWVPNIDYPCPDLTRLFSANGIAQALFDNCFEIPDGPDAPDLDFIELDRELIMILTNDINTSNNAFELYSERGLEIPTDEPDSMYVFEGYKIYQFSGPDVIAAEKDDITRSRLIFQVDVRNGVTAIYNWRSIADPTPFSTEPLWIPEIQVRGADEGIRHTFRIREDQFAAEDRRLINHKNYYFLAVAYGYNNYGYFDPTTTLGQRKPYLEGRRNVRVYNPLPRPIVYSKLNSQYGDGPVITRLAGRGAGGNFLDLVEGTREEIIMGMNQTGELTYKPGQGPVEAKIFNPLIAQDGCYILEFDEPNGSTGKLSAQAGWRMWPEDDPSYVIHSDRTIDSPNEQIIQEFGISVFIGQTPDPGDKATPRNGIIGMSMEYLDPAGVQWLNWFPEGGGPGISGVLAHIFNFLKTGRDEVDEDLDPHQGFNLMDGMYPFQAMDYRRIQPPENFIGYMVTPSWLDNAQVNTRGQVLARLQNLNNVDIVFTSDKTKWSRAVVVETANWYFTEDPAGPQLPTVGGSRNMEVRNVPSVTKDDLNGDGLPDVDPDDSRVGFGWFPGYAIDVETGRRLNIFFGENSIYTKELQSVFPDYPGNGNDMMWNPSNEIFSPSGLQVFVSDFPMGGMHYVYVTHQDYDGCASIGADLRLGGSALFKARALRHITWAGIPIVNPAHLLSYADGLIPNDVVVKLRVDKSYQTFPNAQGVEEYPKYRMCFEGVEAQPLFTDHEVNEALAKINVVPNPYLGYSVYETSPLVNTVKITNLPANCVVTIYSIDGRFVRRYNRNEAGIVQSPPRTNPPIVETQIYPDIEWDMKNSKGIPIASGVYLIHVDAPGLGEHVIKWFGVNRPFDPSGL